MMKIAVVLASQLMLFQLSEANISLEFIKSHSHRQLASAPHILYEQHHRRFTHLDPTHSHERHTQQNELENDYKQKACDQAFIDCLPNEKCLSCFFSLKSKGIDWASVTPDTPCLDVTKFLIEGGHCELLKDDAIAIDQFCQTFNACVVWDDDNSKSSKSKNHASDKLDCANLTKCDWEGIHQAWVGDGICHDNIEGCYNTEICHFDGGDCCEDKCVSESDMKECGHDGYKCRDPTSQKCDSTLTSKCILSDDDIEEEDDTDTIMCGHDETAYRLIMYDSFGDGWDNTKLHLLEKDTDTPIWIGGLVGGAEGREFLCLSKNPTCYTVKVNGGSWGNEVSWEIRLIAEGTRSIADGGAPMECEFAVAGDACDRTCTGKSNIDPSDDPDYKTYKELFTCVQEKCVIQVGTCRDDPSCKPCVEQRAPEYCFANDNFNAVVDCGLCSCKGKEKMESFCASKAAPGAVIPRPIQPDDQNTSPKECTAAETLAGSGAVMAFSKCTSMDQVKMMITDFNQENFGQLDAFERCAHSFKFDHEHGGKPAHECMQYLVDSINFSDDVDYDDGVPRKAIASLAYEIYHNAESFCECASKSSADCPLCPSFRHFKTLLYESIDACQALDEIDCDAWSEFYVPCKEALQNQFTFIDFRSSQQCDFVKSGCNITVPFPAFRKLDCGREISKSAWDFYTIYDRGCLQGDERTPPRPIPNPNNDRTPPPSTLPNKPKTEAPSPESTSRPTLKPYTPTSDTTYVNPTIKPYVPDDDDMSSSVSKDYTPGEVHKKSHFFRNVLILVLMAGAGFAYYKRRQTSFSFRGYRQAPRNFGNSDLQYSGLSLEPNQAATSSFQPPTLPPQNSYNMEQL